jgi:peptide/nickel transport system substrate-binding protein
MALPAAAPVPYQVEGGPKYTGATYGPHPVASGPFKVRSYHQRKSLTLVRNPDWQQSTDDIRHPLVTKVDLVIDSNVRDIDRQLRDGRADARADGGVQTASLSERLIRDGYKAHADDPVAPATRYLAVLPSAIPNVHCRRAIFYAVDKTAAVAAFGGPTAGVAAKSMTPPGIQGYSPIFEPYPSGTAGLGDIPAARYELRRCGQPHGFTTKLTYATPSEFGPPLFKAEQKALRRVGIKISVPPGITGPYGCSTASPANLRQAGIGLAIRTLSAEYPTGLGLYHPVPSPSPCLESESIDLTQLHDPSVDRVLGAAARGQANYADWESLDRAVMRSATYLPLTWEKTLYYRNPRLTNVTCNNALANGIYDFVNVGVR